MWWMLVVVACGGKVQVPQDTAGSIAPPTGLTDPTLTEHTGETGVDTEPAAAPCPPAPADAVDWLAPGPYPVGVRTWEGTLEYQGTQQHLLQLTYPATTAGLDAPVDAASGPHPLLVFEHAYGSAYDQYDWLFPALASRGWIVASAEHDANGWNSTSDWWGAHAYLADETAELVIGWSESAGSEWLGAVDLDRIAFGGHSHGGGGVLRTMQSWLPLNPSGDREVQAVVLITVRPDLDGSFDSYAPVYGGMAPLLNVGAGYDQDSTTAYGQTVAVYEPHGRPGAMLWVEGAEHYSFTDDVSDGYATIAREEARSVAGQGIVSFLEAVVNGDHEALALWRGDAGSLAATPPVWTQWHDAETVVLDAFEGEADVASYSGAIVGIPGQTFVNGFLGDSLFDQGAEIDLVLAELDALLPGGGRVLFYQDASRGTDTYGLALDARAATMSTTRTASADDFAALLEDGGWDLVFAAHQDGSSSATMPFDDALAAWVCGGGKALISDFRVASSTAATTLACAGASHDGVTNWAEMTSTADLFDGALTSTNPGWGIYTYGLATAHEVYATTEIEVEADHTASVSDIGRPVVASGMSTFGELWALDWTRDLYSPTWVLDLGWQAAGASVSWDVGDLDVTAHPVLSLRFAPMPGDPANPVDARIDLDIELEDAAGTVAVWSLSEAPQGAIRPTPDNLVSPKAVFETWRVPLRALRDRTPGFDLAHIAAVRLIARSASGRVMVDDLEWSGGEGCG
jgi:hypothetical protein